MKHISKLSGIGIDKRCLIVGGGESVNKFEWDLLTDTYIICINNHLSQMANMIIYYDADMCEYFKKHYVSSDTILMGFKKGIGSKLDHTSSKCTHYYTYQDMMYGDSGFHALQFADKIFNFNDIYLIGYDYKTSEKSYHFDEVESDPDKKNKFEKFSIGMVLARYDDIKWTNNIHNCSKSSKLKTFPFGVPY